MNQFIKVHQGFKAGDKVQAHDPDRPELDGPYIVTGIKPGGKGLNMTRMKPLAEAIKKVRIVPA
jgi:hypothetical protein